MYEAIDCKSVFLAAAYKNTTFTLKFIADKDIFDSLDEVTRASTHAHTRTHTHTHAHTLKSDRYDHAQNTCI